MQVEVVLDGEKRVVEVDPERGTVRVGERPYPFTVVSDKNGRVELEIAGEKVVVDGWPEGLARTPGPLAVDGELRKAEVGSVVGAPSASPARIPNATAREAAPAAPEATPTSAGPGTSVYPPMPGRVVELRVAEGARVERGQVLLVLEAMKMRNEVASPVAGVVGDVKVATGANVRARETMLTVVPDAAAV